MMLANVDTGRLDGWFARPYAEALIGRSYQLFLGGDLDGAGAACDGALHITPGHPRALALKSIVLTYQGRVDEALLAAGEAMCSDVAAGLSFAARGIALARRGELSEAIIDCEYGVALAPSCPITNYVAACCWARLGQKDRCRERLTRAFEIAGGLRGRACQEDEAVFNCYKEDDWFTELTGGFNAL